MDYQGMSPLHMYFAVIWYLIQGFTIGLWSLLVTQVRSANPGQVALAITSVIGFWWLVATFYKWLIGFGIVTAGVAGLRVAGVV